jgi:hypothetical protein
MAVGTSNCDYCAYSKCDSSSSVKYSSRLHPHNEESTFRLRGTSMLDKCNTESISFYDQTETKMQGEYRSVKICRKSVFEAEFVGT